MDGVVVDGCTGVSASSTILVRQTSTTITKCKVCGDFTRYSYYGAIVCPSCKVFFRRTISSQQEQLICYFNDDCNINVNTRRICRACRLKKCFANGMCVEMIRSCRIKRSEDKQLTTDSVQSTAILVLHQSQNQSEQIPVANLLRSDRSTLSADQWNFLSNLVYCFDEYSGYSFVEHYVSGQNALPIKLRYKYSSVKNFFTSLLGIAQLIFEKNRDFLSLSTYNRTGLLRSTAQYTTSIGVIFLLRQHHLFDNLLFYTSTELIFRPTTTAIFRSVTSKLDPDETFMKLILAVFAFSTTSYTVYTQLHPIRFKGIKTILSIQNMYVDLLWRYLLHKYDHYESVIRFSNVIKCFVSIHTAIIEANESHQYIEMIDTVIEQTERTLRL